jgi:hypothetical protein
MRSRRSVLLVAGAAALLVTGCAQVLPAAGRPECKASSELITIAQSVTSATQLPCIEAFPIGWGFGGIEIDRGRTRFWLDSDRAGVRSVRVTLDESCDVTAASEVPREVVEITPYLQLTRLEGRREGTWYYQFDGGCVTHDFDFPEDAFDFSAFTVELQDMLGFFPRSALDERVEEELDQPLDP